jgi:hypothetical protein
LEGLSSNREVKEEQAVGDTKGRRIGERGRRLRYVAKSF